MLDDKLFKKLLEVRDTLFEKEPKRKITEEVSEQDLLAIADSQLGWAVAQQLKSILDAPSAEGIEEAELNSNAIRMIYQFVDNRDDQPSMTAATAIEDWVHEGYGDPFVLESKVNEKGGKVDPQVMKEVEGHVRKVLSTDLKGTRLRDAADSVAHAILKMDPDILDDEEFGPKSKAAWKEFVWDMAARLGESKVNEQEDEDEEEFDAPKPPAEEPEDEEPKISRPKPKEEEAPEITKEYIGNTEDDHYYLISNEDENNVVEDLQIVDQEGVEKYSAKANSIEVENVAEFLFMGIRELRIESIEFGIFEQYLFPYVFEEDEEEGMEEPEDEFDEPEEPMESKKVAEGLSDAEQDVMAKFEVDLDLLIQRAVKRVSLPEEAQKWLKEILRIKIRELSDYAWESKKVQEDARIGPAEEEETKWILEELKRAISNLINEAVARVKQSMGDGWEFRGPGFLQKVQEILGAVSGSVKTMYRAEGKLKESVQSVVDRIVDRVMEDIGDGEIVLVDSLVEMLEDYDEDNSIFKDVIKNYILPRIGSKGYVVKGERIVKESKKHLIEMKITDHENNTFDVYLVDDESGSMDTVIDISGREFRFNTEFASHWRDESGELTEEGLKELALDALSNMEEEEYHELVARGMESEEEPEPERRKGNEFEGKEVDEMATVGATYRERETGEPVKVVHIGLNDETGEAVVEVEKDGVTLPAYTGREFLAKYGLLSMPHRESKVDEVTMGVDYIKKAKGRMKDASAAMKDKDYDRASEILSDIADDCADGAKAAKKMKIVADDKAEKAAEKEKAAKVEEAESEKFGKYDYQGFKDAISHSISDEEAQELWKDFKSFDLRSDFESERWEIWMRDRLPKKWESKTNEGEGDLAGSTKEVFEVEFEKDGKKETTRVMHFSEAEAKELVAKRPGVKVLGVKKITSADESKSIEEGVVPASDTCPQCGEVMIMDSKIKEQRCQACGYGRKTKETKSKESKGDPLTRTLLDLLK